MTIALQTMWSQENSIYIRTFFFRIKFIWKWILKRPFNCGLLSRCCRENYMLEQSNIYLYTYSCVSGMAHWIPSKSYSTVSRIPIKMVNLEPTASATYISFFQLDMIWIWQESRDVRAEFLLCFLLEWTSSTTDFYHVLNQVSLATKKESVPLKDLCLPRYFNY